MKINGDPNGIRTRVTAVKGRCPRPLDDRVEEAREYQKHTRACKLFGDASAPIPTRLQRNNEFCRSLRSTAMFCKNLEAVLDHAIPAFRIMQELHDFELESVAVVCLHSATRGEQGID